MRDSEKYDKNGWGIKASKEKHSPSKTVEKKCQTKVATKKSSSLLPQRCGFMKSEIKVDVFCRTGQDKLVLFESILLLCGELELTALISWILKSFSNRRSIPYF